MSKIVSIKTLRPLSVIIFPITENNIIRLPKSGVKRISNIKEKYAKALRKELKRKPNTKSPFKVEIFIYKGIEDKLGTGDLDNYSKGILDIITKTKAVWQDDKQVNELHIVRKTSNDFSKIGVVINEIN